MPRRTLALSRVYRLLEPGPVILLTTANKGRTNVMPLSWHTMMEFEPPLVGLIVSNRNYSFAMLAASGECVINIPSVELAHKAVACGNISGRKTDKFSAFGLTPIAASHVRAPLIGECYANLECKVIDRKLVAKYNFFVVQVVKAWIDTTKKDARTIHHCGRGDFFAAGRRFALASKAK